VTCRALAWLLLTPWCLPGQLRLFLVEGQQERLIQGSLDLGAVETGDRREAACRVRNAGVTPVRLETLQVGGMGFGLAASPPLPRSLEPGAALDFSVHFEAQAPGNYSAVLWLNSQSVLLRAVALPAATVFLERDGQRLVLRPSSTLDFGSIELGLSATRRFLLENQTNVRLEVAVAVAGASFRAAAGLRSPIALAPGETATVEVTFEPQQAGLEEGVLEISQRSFRLRGTGLEPPFPKPQIFFDPPEPASGQTVRMFVRLDTPSRVAGRGEAQIEFHPAAPNLPDDLAIVFLDVRSRSCPLGAVRGDDMVWFGPRQDVWFQTGTTAGRIVATVRLGDHSEQAALTLAPMPPVLRSLKAARGASSVEVSLAGFDNTRSASQVAFSFFDAAGPPV